VVEGLESVQGDTELADEGLDEQGLGGDDACIARQRRGGLYGVETFCDDVSRAHVVVAAEGLQGRAPCEWRRFEGRPATQKVTKDRGVFILKPLQHGRKRVFQSPREARGDPHFVADHAAAMCDALCQGAQRGALRMERLQLVAMGQQPCKLQGGIGGVIFGPAGGKGFTIPRQCQRIDGKEPQKGIRAQGGDKGPFGACEADGDRFACEPLAQGPPPRLNGFWRVCEDEVLSLCGARGLYAHIMLGISPVEADKGSQCCVCFFMSDLPACGTGVPRDMRACVLRRHDREPMARQTLSIR
jgi:hypothetical protein